MNNSWVEPEIRDAVTERISYLCKRSGIPAKVLVKVIDISSVKYHRWLKRSGTPNRHNGKTPKTHWLAPDEIMKIEDYAREHYSNNDYYLRDGYRRIAYTLIDLDIVAASPSSVYRVLLKAGLLNRWNTNKSILKGTGFKQPYAPHKHWHTDIKYLNFNGSFVFLISVIDGFSRFILHHEVRHTMAEYDVELTIQKAKDKFPYAKPTVITDNGSQYISKDFKAFIKEAEFNHIKTSVNHPQSNGKIERFHRSISEECLRVKSPVNFDDFLIYIEDYINFYNYKRLHSALYYLTPNDFLFGTYKEKLSVREAKLCKAENDRADYWNSLSKAA